MQILFDTTTQIDASVEKVWEALNLAERRHEWQDGIRSAKLLSGTAGYRGAQVELVLERPEQKVVERVRRSHPLERLQTQFTLGDCQYQQVIYLTRLDEEKTTLTYHCKQSLDARWRRILHIRPSVPAFLLPSVFETLADKLKEHALPN